MSKIIDKPSPKRDPDLVNAEIAIKRAAERAREDARKSGTTVVISENGQVKEDSGQYHVHSKN